MDVHVTAEAAKKLKELAAASGRAPEGTVEKLLPGNTHRFQLVNCFTRSRTALKMSSDRRN